MKKVLGLTMALLCAACVAHADGLPADGEIRYPSLQMEEGAEAPLEMDESAVDESARPTPEPESAQSAPMIRPGDKKPVNSITIETISDIKFSSPYVPGQVNIRNAADSAANLQYLLRVSVAELQRQAGRTGYTPEQYDELSSQEGFDPETSYIVLSQTKGIAPGMMVETMTLGALPDGSILPVGDYKAQMVMAAYDTATSKRSMVGAVVEVQFHVLSDIVELAFTDYRSPLAAFNPIGAGRDVSYGVMISQAELEAVAGSPHRTKETLALQAGDPSFDPAYEFVTLFESGPVAPGAFLEEDVVLSPLPDGAPLPPGRYVAWLVRYGYDASLDAYAMLDANTQLTLVIP